MSTSSTDGEDPVAKVCRRCQAAMFRDHEYPILEQRSEDGKHYLHSRDNSELETKFRLVDELPILPKLGESASTGCDFCSFLRHIILSDDTTDVIKRELATNGIGTLGTCQVHISVGYHWKALEDGLARGVDSMTVMLDVEGLDHLLHLCCVVEASSDSKAVADWLGLAAPSNQSYTDAESISRMRKRIETCTKTHRHKSEHGSFIPERLILVKGHDLRLVLKSDLVNPSMPHSKAVPQAPKYAALSYCWGSPSDAEGQPKTTTDSLEERRAGIRENELTTVLRDAVRITRALSIPYLWVDALCILQKNQADWQHQCSEMDKIYGNARVTLCAAASTRCHEGFLRQRGRRIRLPFQSDLITGIKGSFCVQFKYTRYIPVNTLIYSDLNECRLPHRGWTFQEKMLSTRLIFFGNSNLHFVCESKSQSRGRAFEKPYPYYTLVSEAELVGRDRTELYLAWNRVFGAFCQYTGSTSYTNPTDILPSLAGPAAIFHRQLRDKYAAGHWSGDLYCSLCWLRFDSPGKDSRLVDLQPGSTYLAPTWSRIGKGVCLSVYHNRLFSNLRSEVEQLVAESHVVGSNPFGAVAHAELRLTSHAVDLNLVDSNDLSIREWGRSLQYGKLFFKDQSFGIFRLDFDFPPGTSALYDEHESEWLREMATHRWVLLGSCEVKLNDKIQQGRSAFGLILRQASNSDQFHRVGAFLPNIDGMFNLDSASDFEEAGNLKLLLQHSEVKTMVVL